MKKIFLSIFLFSLISYSKNYDNEIKKFEKIRLENKLYDFNNVALNSNLSYFKNELVLENRIKWSIFDYNLGVSILNKSIVSHNIGISKTLNDFFYNKFKEADVNYNISILNLNMEKENEIFENLEIIKKYFVQEKLLELNEKEAEKIKVEEKILNKNFENGDISKFDYEALKNNINNLRKKYLFDNENFKFIKEEYDDLNLKLDINRNLVKLDDNILKKYVKNNIRALELEIEKLKIEKSKDLAYNVIPSITPRFSYDIKNNNASVSLDINKNLNILDFTHIDNQKYLSNIIKEKEEKIVKEYRKNYLNIKSTYDNLYFQHDLILSNMDILEKEMNLLEKKYELGIVDLKKILDKRSEFLKLKLELESNIFDINIFELRIKRGVK